MGAVALVTAGIAAAFWVGIFFGHYWYGVWCELHGRV